MKDYHINIFFSQEDEGYIADIPDLAICSAFGRTPAEALAKVETAKQGLAGSRACRGQTNSRTKLSPGYLSDGVMK